MMLIRLFVCVRFLLLVHYYWTQMGYPLECFGASGVVDGMNLVCEGMFVCAASMEHCRQLDVRPFPLFPAPARTQATMVSICFRFALSATQPQVHQP